MRSASATAELFWPLEFDREASPATVGCWVVSCPWAHPIWRDYMVSVVHLRPLEGKPPAKLRFPAAEHELVVCALDPDHPAPRHAADVHLLMPPNLVFQFRGLDDEKAAFVGERLTRVFAERRASPDTDHRRSTLIALAWLVRDEGGEPEVA